MRELGGELSGNFKEAMTALFDPPAHYDAWSLHEAINVSDTSPLRDSSLLRSSDEKEPFVKSYSREAMQRFVPLLKPSDDVGISDDSLSNHRRSSF